uniref:Uncharacterized protein n=1 Tax=Kalanchoe fedtschenkoi TaxID=63787 RepID=A0A7N0REC7_KALFE
MKIGLVSVLACLLCITSLVSGSDISNQINCDNDTSHTPPPPPILPPTPPPTNLPPVNPPTSPPQQPPVAPPTFPPVKPPSQPPVAPPVATPPPVNPPTQPPVAPPMAPPVSPPTSPPIKPPTQPPVAPPMATPPPVNPPTQPPVVPPVAPPPPSPPTPVGIRFVAVKGKVYCKSCKYTGLRSIGGATALAGAVVKLQCKKSKYTQVITTTTDAKGHFMFMVPQVLTSYEAYKCRVSIVSSPSKICSKRTNMNFGIAGSRLFSPVAKKINKRPYFIYSVGPFVFEAKKKCY